MRGSSAPATGTVLLEPPPTVNRPLVGCVTCWWAVWPAGGASEQECCTCDAVAFRNEASRVEDGL